MPAMREKLTSALQWDIQLEAKFQDEALWLRPQWHGPMMTEFMATRYMYAMVDICDHIFRDPSISISKALDIGNQDIAELWRWNHDLPPLITDCMHDLISHEARRQPTATAIDSWDGQLSYEEVEKFSTHMAHRLADSNVSVGKKVLLCFEKSRWTAVAVLAVMKAGATFILMDPSQPLGRLRTIAQEVQAETILTSKINHGLGALVLPQGKVLSVSAETFTPLHTKGLCEGNLPAVPSDGILYIIFTSGSTGKPKGVVISHETYTSSAIPRSDAVGYRCESRVLDFASYAFDVSVDSMLCTLFRGGCLCIPSNEERMNDLSGAIRRMGVTMANMTPSVARILDHDIIPSLHSLGLGGESCSAGDVARWGQHTRIVIGYGPSECTVGCTINSSAAIGKPYVNMGTGNGAVIWIVDPEDHNRLMPIGAVGELLVEGPIVGQGYLNNPTATAAVFIENPPWLLAGTENFPGRNGRLYKTGDLARYDPEGNKGLVFVGRKDSQVKIRGQRVELGEIEYNLRSHLPSKVHLSVEVIQPQGKKDSVLVAFIAEPNEGVGNQSSSLNQDVQRVTFTDEIKQIIASIADRLSKVLPIYMVPSIFIAINRMPMLVSGKTDRKVLKGLGSKMVVQDLSDSIPSESDGRKPTSPKEMVLRDLWSRLLGVEKGDIRTRHNFFSLGGDSILAMKLVATSREKDFILTVTDIFSYPIFGEMVSKMIENTSQAELDVPAFSLLLPSLSQDEARITAARLCEVNSTSVEDVYPCTPLQEILLVFSERTSQRFVTQRVAQLPDNLSIDELKKAWEISVAGSPVLRTRIVQLPSYGFVQVVIKEGIDFLFSANLQDYLKSDKSQVMTLGTPLSRYCIVTEHTSGKSHFVWTVHHAIYDGWSTPLIIERVNRALRGLETPRPSQMKHFVHFLLDPERKASRDFWRTQLQGATGPQYPTLPSRSYLPRPDAIHERYIRLQRQAKPEITIASIIRGAWALVASRYTMSHDVVFGETLVGRSIPIHGAEQIEGPMIATVPVRVIIDHTVTVHEFLQRIQDLSITRIPHEHYGMQNIRQVSQDAQLACELKMGIVIQPDNQISTKDYNSDLLSFEDADAAREALHFNSYPLLLACTLKKDGFQLLSSFDSSLISVRQMSRLLAQLECAAQQLSSDMDVQVSEVSCLSEEDCQEIWQWNADPPATLDQESGCLVSKSRAGVLGSVYSNIVVPWIVNPSNHDQLMPVGAVGEMLIEGPMNSSCYTKDPSWLMRGAKNNDGRYGTLHRTGDLVKYGDDGSLIFMGQKEARVSFQGQTIDINEIESHIRHRLPSNVEVFAHIGSRSQDKSTASSNNTQSCLLAFVKETRRDDESLLELGYSGNGLYNLHPAISDLISTDLAELLLRMNKTLGEVLPPYMIPSVYIPLSETPDPLDRNTIDEISSTLTPEQVLELRSALTRLRERQFNKKPTTQNERLLQGLWSDILGLPASSIELDDGFFRLGGDSIMAMKLVSAARQAGYVLTISDIFQHMLLGEMAGALKEAPSAKATENYIPFSTLNINDVNDFVDTKIKPVLPDASMRIQDVLPLTDSQIRDVKATVDTPRSSVQYNMFYLEKSIDENRLEQCCKYLVRQHTILRTVFIETSGSYMQVILENLKVPMVHEDCDQDLETFVTRYCAADIERDFPLAKPFLKFVFVRGQGSHNCLIIRISHAQYDGISLPALIRQLALIYEGSPIPKHTPFESYIHHIRKHRDDSLQYWAKLLKGSSLSQLSLASSNQQISESSFFRRSIDMANRQSNITMATMLTAAWTLILSRRLSVRDVTFGVVVSGRNVDFLDATEVMGPCYHIVPVRIILDSKWTVSDLLQSVQSLSLERGRYESVGFGDLKSSCPNWPSDATFFDSIVHHMDIDDFNSMPFAGTNCKVEIANPHFEPSTPTRVVSFPEAGRLVVGIATSKCLTESATRLLDDLCAVMHEFVETPHRFIFH
ncbi:putative nonribosomal peptide synthase [Phaeomoniella chlamydospora]|uniref:Putative nonribosomal peptide synthase n=1 Tax=Phaeomoniella chlamydospora TaxID=158046 RepID=A0A0G2GCZ6_PHACM|nr:putative nonribosomal peptide synthase [Phaeomoniella chlamydospora]